jgi:hypothetical protein
MGGDVTVTTELGVGSTFTLLLPRVRPELAASPVFSDSHSSAGDSAAVV